VDESQAEAANADAPAEVKQPEGTGQHPGDEPTADSQSPAEAAGYRLRRAPRYGAFAATGVLIGIVVGAVLALSFQAADDYSARTILGYFVAIFGLFGVLIGCGAAVLFDRSRR